VQLKLGREKKAAWDRINAKPPEALDVSAVYGLGIALFALQGPGRGPRGARLWGQSFVQPPPTKTTTDEEGL